MYREVIGQEKNNAAIVSDRNSAAETTRLHFFCIDPVEFLGKIPRLARVLDFSGCFLSFL